MAHHKRRRTKSRRSGCLMCKPWKHQGRSKRSRTKHGIRRQMACTEVKDD